MHALLIGGGGFIGSHLAEFLCQQGDQVRVVSRSIPSFRLRSTNIEYLIGDITNPAFLNQALAKIDLVYHLASSSVPLTAEQDMIGTIQKNLFPTLNLLERMVDYGIPRIIFFSSGGTIYGPSSCLPIKEDHPTNPIGTHGVMKLMLEKYIQLYAHRHQLEYQILRIANAYGERQNPSIQQGIIGVAMYRLLHGEPLDIWGDGSTVRDYVYVGDVIRAAVLAATNPQPRAVLNIGSGLGTALIDVLRQIEQVGNRPLQLRFSTAKVHDVPQHILDIKLARQALAWEPTTALRAGLERTWRWMNQAWMIKELV